MNTSTCSNCHTFPATTSFDRWIDRTRVTIHLCAACRELLDRSAKGVGPALEAKAATLIAKEEAA